MFKPAFYILLLAVLQLSCRVNSSKIEGALLSKRSVKQLLGATTFTLNPCSPVCFDKSPYCSYLAPANCISTFLVNQKSILEVCKYSCYQCGTACPSSSTKSTSTTSTTTTTTTSTTTTTTTTTSTTTTTTTTSTTSGSTTTPTKRVIGKRFVVVGILATSTQQDEETLHSRNEIKK